MAIKSFHNTFNFCEEAIKVNILLQAFPELLRLLKLHKSILYLVTVIINHLVKHYFFSKKSTIHFSQDPAQHVQPTAKVDGDILHCYFGLILQLI